MELLNRRKDGSDFWVELNIVPVANESSRFTHWVSVQRDVSDRKLAEETALQARIVEAENLILEAEILERKRAEAQLLYAAFHDDLTKLRNRAFFMDRLAVTLDRMKRDAGFRCIVLFMDLDRFKLVQRQPRAPGRGPAVDGSSATTEIVRRPDRYARPDGR